MAEIPKKGWREFWRDGGVIPHSDDVRRWRETSFDRYVPFTGTYMQISGLPVDHDEGNNEGNNVRHLYKAVFVAV
jgi:hypothetical protein